MEEARSTCSRQRCSPGRSRTRRRSVEQQNFLIRKRVLEYDDVMNECAGSSTSTGARSSRAATCPTSPTPNSRRWSRGWSRPTPRGDLRGLGPRWSRGARGAAWAARAPLAELDLQTSRSREQIIEILSEDALAAHDRREEEFKPYWDAPSRAPDFASDHRQPLARASLHEMDYLREGIHLRGFAQIDPLVAYKNEASTTFCERWPRSGRSSRG